MAGGTASDGQGETEQMKQQQERQTQQHDLPAHPSVSGQHSSTPQYGGEEAFQMSSVVAALPVDSSDAYSQHGHYPTNVPAGTRQLPAYGVQPQVQPYQAYTQASGLANPHIQYTTYVDQPGISMPPYSPMHAQYPQAMYGSPQTSPQYGSFPAGYGPRSPIQPGFQGQPRPFPAQEYGQMGNQAVLPVMSAGPRQPYRPQPGIRQPIAGGASNVPSAPRGPPRKPKQSGHALWVGNLPPGTQVGDLKDHFSRDATKEIESIFLISKSNCAFVNYKTEPACAAAMTRFHDSRFQGVRLVCRLRKGPGSVSSPSSSDTSVPSGPAALQSGSAQSQSAVDAITQNRESSAKATEAASFGEQTVNDKYFVVKSLTVEDLELSVRNGIWATQGHNEDALNKAYESVDNVFLVFSANKSGEYFGYARMESAINDEIAKDLEWKPYEEKRVPEATPDPELPRSIPTPATEFAPKGRIIDDSARGTIFWEAGSDTGDQEADVADGLDGKNDGDGGSEDETEGATEKDDTESGPSAPGEGSHQTFGRPFKVIWVSTTKLPFYRTRGLRNPWNANREVKIARDGTELETNVGRRLIAMFHRTAVPQPIQIPGQQGFVQLPPHMRYGHGPMSPGRY